MSEQQPPAPEEPQAEPLVSVRVLVTFGIVAIFFYSAYLLYAGATGSGTFKKVCNAAKGRSADTVVAELTTIGATASPPNEIGTVTVVHKDGAHCVVRVTDSMVFSALFEEP